MTRATINRDNYTISNIKISCIIAIKDANLLLLNSDDKDIKYFGNFVVVRRNNFVYSIFKKKEKIGGRKKNEEQKGSSSNVVLYHVNITKIPSTDQIASSIDCLKNVIRSEYHVVAKKINNLTCSYDSKISPVPLLDLMKIVKKAIPSVKRVKFNPERFPGMFISFPSNTLLIFSSGKMIVIGGKNERVNLQTIEEMVNFLNVQRPKMYETPINADF